MWSPLVAQKVKNLPAMQETTPRSGRSPEEGNGYPLHMLAWEIPWTEEPDGLQSMEYQRVGHTTEQLTLIFTLSPLIYVWVLLLLLFLIASCDVERGEIKQTTEDSIWQSCLLRALKNNFWV